VILADSSIWIGHLRAGSPDLQRLLEEDMILMHPWIHGELALGSIRDRGRFLSYLALLPRLPPASDAAILTLIEDSRLAARGIGWVDAGLLAACVAYPCRLWTLDGRLARLAGELGAGMATAGEGS
jgi:predicted nucleic acid-binding protein